MGIIVLGFDFAPTTGIGKPCVGRKIAAFPVLRRGGPMWASAPTNDHGKSTNLKGGQSRPPLQVTVKNNDSISSAPTTGIGKPCVGRKTATFPVLHRRGRCPHRPAGRTRFMAFFRRIRVDFPFCTVGAVGRYCIGFRFRSVGVDAYIDPSHRPNGNAPAQGRSDVIALGFDFAP